MVLVVVIKIRERADKGPQSYLYKNEMSLDDYKLMAILFEDLERNGANIEKIYREWKKRKGEQFPF
jgi:hypothetical protein